VTPFAPHSPATPAKRHEHMFQDAKFPRYDSFNPSDENQKDRPSWIKDMPPLTNQQIDDMDNFYRNRLRSLQAVDEALDKIVETLDELGLTDDTYFFYTADNGQHFGDFRIPAGKRQAYETDVLVPLLVRSPAVQKGTTSTQVVQSVDLGPTFLDIATTSHQHHSIDTTGLSKMVDLNAHGEILQSSYPMDGKSIIPLLESKIDPTPLVNNFRWAALLEMYGGSSVIGLRYNTTKGFHHNHMVRTNPKQWRRIFYDVVLSVSLLYIYLQQCCYYSFIICHIVFFLICYHI
ncbi:MAG: arylsulfatase A-like enzyme, partial [Bacillariaceae sp.]|jgi:arylsulfatase A-like enzyme